MKNRTRLAARRGAGSRHPDRLVSGASVTGVGDAGDMTMHDGPDHAAARLAAKQHGLLSRADAIGVGLSDRQIRVRIASRGWTCVLRGVYALPGSAPGWQRDVHAACLATGGVASHISAAALYRLLDASMVPHVTVPASGSARTPLARFHRSDLADADMARLHGMAVTSVERTLVDLATVVDRPLLERLVDDVLAAGRSTVTEVLAALARVGRGRRGIDLLRSTLAVWEPLIRPGSPAEVRLLRLVVGWGFPTPQTQVEVRDGSGRLVARLDLGWADRRIGLEYDSVRWHGPRRWGHDEHRYARLEALGWRVDSATKADLVPGERRLPDLLRTWLSAAA